MYEPTFDAAEYATRVARTQESMREQGFDLLLVADPANLYYLTGYNAWSFYTPQLLVVPARGDLTFYIREMDAPGAALTTRLTGDQVRAYPESYIHQTDCHPLDWITADMRKRGLDDGVVAVEVDAFFHTVRAHNALVTGLKRATIVDARELVNWVRSIKSPAEISKMRIAGKIITKVMTTALDIVGPGVRQCDAAAEITRASIQGLPDAGGDYTSGVPVMNTGAGAGAAHLTWTDAPFVEGEATALELAGCYQRYHAPLARTVFLGTPPKRLVRLADIVDEGMSAALAAVKPGIETQDIEQAWRDVISPHGLTKSSRLGYSIGVGYPPDWGEHTISIRSGENTVLRENMTFHIILGMWMDGWGYELSEPFVVTDDGAECFASVLRGLTVKK